MGLPRPSDFYLVLASTSGCVPQPGRYNAVTLDEARQSTSNTLQYFEVAENARDQRGQSLHKPRSFDKTRNPKSRYRLQTPQQ